jgi:hypothetical protein
VTRDISAGISDERDIYRSGKIETVFGRKPKDYAGSQSIVANSGVI